MNILAWISTFLSALGLVLVAKKNIWGWIAWIVSDTLWIYYYILLHNTPSIVVWIMFDLFNLYGLWSWLKKR